MTNNRATLHKLDQMRLRGMARALRTSLDTGRLPLGAAPPRPHHHRQMRLREKLRGLCVGP